MPGGTPSKREEGAQQPFSTPSPCAAKPRRREVSPDSPVVLANQVDPGMLQPARLPQDPSSPGTSARAALDAEEPLLQDNDERFCLLPVK